MNLTSPRMHLIIDAAKTSDDADSAIAKIFRTKIYKEGLELQKLLSTELAVSRARERKYDVRLLASLAGAIGIFLLVLMVDVLGADVPWYIPAVLPAPGVIMFMVYFHRAVNAWNGTVALNAIFDHVDYIDQHLDLLGVGQLEDVLLARQRDIKAVKSMK